MAETVKKLTPREKRAAAYNKQVAGKKAKAAKK